MANFNHNEFFFMDVVLDVARGDSPKQMAVARWVMVDRAFSGLDIVFAVVTCSLAKKLGLEV